MQCGLLSTAPDFPLERCGVFLGVKILQPLQSPLPRGLTLSWYLAVTWAPSDRISAVTPHYFQYFHCLCPYQHQLLPALRMSTAVQVTEYEILQQYSRAAIWCQEGGKKTQAWHSCDKLPQWINRRSSYTKKKGTSWSNHIRNEFWNGTVVGRDEGIFPYLCKPHSKVEQPCQPCAWGQRGPC